MWSWGSVGRGDGLNFVLLSLFWFKQRLDLEEEEKVDGLDIMGWYCVQRKSIQGFDGGVGEKGFKLAVTFKHVLFVIVIWQGP